MATNPYLARAQSLQDDSWKKKDEAKNSLQIAPLTQAIAADRQKLTAFIDPATGQPYDDPGHQKEYKATVDGIADKIGRMRAILGQKEDSDEPDHFGKTITGLMDKLHIHRDLAHRLRQRQQWNAQNAQTAQDTAAGAAPAPGSLTADEQHQANRVKGGLDAKASPDKPETWSRNGLPVQVGDKWMQPEINKAGDNRLQPMPDGWKPAAKVGSSAFAVERNDYATTIGKQPSEWTPEDTQKFYQWRFHNLQPLARAKMGLEQQKLQIAQASLELRRTQNDWKDTQDVTKSLAPIEKIKAVANATDTYVSNPTGPGDAALTMAFFEAAKQMDDFSTSGGAQGIRFTAQEQKLIQGSRGWADAAKANVQRFGSGTLYDDHQRKQMADVIKIAKTRAEEHEKNIVSSMGQLNPTAVRAAAGSAGIEHPPIEGPKTKQLKATKGGQSNVIVVSPEDMK